MRLSNPLFRLLGTPKMDSYEGFDIPCIPLNAIEEMCTPISNITDSLQLEEFLTNINIDTLSQSIFDKAPQQSISLSVLKVEFTDVLKKYLSALDNDFNSDTSAVLLNLTKDLKNGVKRVCVFKQYGCYA